MDPENQFSKGGRRVLNRQDAKKGAHLGLFTESPVGKEK